MTAYLTTDTLPFLIPEIILVALAVWTYVAGAFYSGRSGFTLVALAGMALAAMAMYRQDATLNFDVSQTTGPLIVDYFGHAARWVVLLVGIAFVLLAGRSIRDELGTEYLGSLLLVIAGLMLTCVAGELVLLFLALELISIPTYILLYLGRRDAATQEATAKYFYLSILSSAILLYGLSFLYGVTGTTQLAEIRQRMAEVTAAGDPLASMVPLALLLILGGLAFKLAAVPFHFYAPDVYQGATSANAAVLSVAPKLAGMIVLIRLVVVGMPGVEPIAWQLLTVVAAVTMTLGNVLALWQQNIRRLLAYSSIAHAGYMLMGIATALAVAGSTSIDDVARATLVDGVGASLFYLLVYIVATVGAFAALCFVSAGRREINDVAQLAGWGKTYPVVAIAMALFMLSLTGIPPLAGFWGKLTLLLSTLSVTSAAPDTTMGTWFLALTIIAALNAAIAAGYYLRVVAVMYFRSPTSGGGSLGGAGAWLVTVTAGILVIALGLRAGPWITDANQASRSVRQTQQPSHTAQSAPIKPRDGHPWDPANKKSMAATTLTTAHSK